jgi:hypothetical protein
VQVNKKAGLDFAVVMKAFLRADPDIIMVGEMRDAETTGTGIEASLTGHLVFATLHTNSAPESIIRLLDMGITHRRAVLIIYGVTVLLCISAIAIAFGRQWQVGAAILGVSAVLFGLIRFIGYFEYLMVLGRQSKRIRSRHVEWLRKVVLRVPAQFSAATSEEELLKQLDWLAHESRLDSIELKAGGAPVGKWAGNDYQDMSQRDVTSAAFGLYADALELKFSWKSEFGDVPPQMDILLQLVVDQMEEHLRRVGSALVPAAPPVQTPEDSPATSTLKPAHH